MQWLTVTVVHLTRIEHVHTLQPLGDETSPLHYIHVSRKVSPGFFMGRACLVLTVVHRTRIALLHTLQTFGLWLWFWWQLYKLLTSLGTGERSWNLVEVSRSANCHWRQNEHQTRRHISQGVRFQAGAPLSVVRRFNHSHLLVFTSCIWDT